MTLSRKPYAEGAFSTLAPGKRPRWRPDPEDVAALAEAKAGVYERCKGLCEGCGERLPSAFDLAHRVSRRVKKWRYDLRNLLALCRPCHTLAGSGNQAARTSGHWLRTTDDPATEPVTLYVMGRRTPRKVILTADCGYEDVA